jgi:integrase/recombinase XerD
MVACEVSGVRVLGPLAPYADGFAARLAADGYMPQSVLRHLRLMDQVSRWLLEHEAGSAALTATAVGQFFQNRRDRGYRALRTAKALRPLLDYLRQCAAAPADAGQAPPDADAEILGRYREYLASARGLSAESIRGAVCVIGPFLASRPVRGWAGLQQLTASEVHEFLLAEASRRSGKGAGCVVKALRSFLRFLHAAGIISQPLADAVPPVCSWPLAGLPKALDGEQAQALLAACDPRTPAGLRDRAVLTLLLRLGLRACEVASLTLDDISWRTGEITIRGKGNRRDSLPLPADVGTALAGYLTAAGARAAAGRAVFTRVKAPRGQLTADGVRNIVRRAAQRAGLAGGVTAHQLRHTAATGMLRAGSPLAEISQVLRHARPHTTAIYAKVDYDALSGLARPWPGACA